MNTTNNSEINVKSNNKDKFKTELKELGHYLLLKLKSPFTIIGLGIIIFAILISIFPQILTPYSYNEAIGVYTGAWSPPSPDHLLGQTQFGRDVLARIIYAIPNSLIIGVSAVFIGLIIALIIGIPISLVNKKLNISSEAILIPLFILPLIIISIIGFMIFWYILYPSDIPLESIYAFLFGIYLIPIFTFLIAKERLSFYDISKKVIPYIPLLMGFIIVIDTFTGFLGLSSHLIIQLGNDILTAREFMYVAPWASLFPSLAVFILVSGFVILYAGLQISPRELHYLSKKM